MQGSWPKKYNYMQEFKGVQGLFVFIYFSCIAVNVKLRSETKAVLLSTQQIFFNLKESLSILPQVMCKYKM